MSMITNDWKDALSDEFKKDYYKKLYTFVKDEYSRCVVYPCLLYTSPSPRDS